MAAFYLLIIFTLLQLMTFTWSKSSHISLISNGYNDVVVALPGDYAEEKRLDLIQSIQNLFADATMTLYMATKQRATFRNIIILIPKLWGSSWMLNKEGTKVIYQSYTHGEFPALSDANIVIASDIPNRNKPYTLQEEGCGKEGLRIVIPLDFFNLHFESQSIQFIHHWAQYRYGVFPEGGFSSSSRYPAYYSIPGTKEIKITSCTNRPVSFNFTQIPVEEQNTYFMPSGNIHAGLSDFTLDPNDLNLTHSSLMDQRTFPKAHQFCDGDHSLENLHNSESPSKHNVLCSQESVWNVIVRNPDFFMGKNPPPYRTQLELELNFVQEGNLRLVFAVDVSLFMVENERYNLVRNALSKLILLDLPLETEIGFVFFDDNAKSTTEMFVLSSNEARKIFLESIPFHEPSESDSKEACISCAISHSLQVLKDSPNDDSSNGVIVLITSNITTHDLYELENDIMENRVRIITLLFQNNDVNKNDDFEALVFRSKGWLVNIKEENEAQMLSHLYMAMSRLMNELTSSEIIDNLLLVETLSPSENSISLEFNVDSYAANDLRIVIIGPDLDFNNLPFDTSNTILRLPSGKELFFTDDFSREEFIPGFLYKTTNAEIGYYVLRSKWRNTGKGELVIIVYGKQTVKSSNYIVSDLWTSSRNISMNEPLRLYTEVRSENYPIADLRIQATLLSPNGSVADSFELLDNGLGDPDITEGDGIYSRYLPRFMEEGYYSVFVKVSGEKPTILRISDRDCCGNTFETGETIQGNPFVRTIGPLSFKVRNLTVKNDLGPNRIFDFRVSKFNQEEREMTLKWSAAGSYMDHGAASSYVIKLFEDRFSAQRRFENSGILLEHNREIKNFTKAQEYGSSLPMEYHIKLPETLQSGFYFLAVKAESEYETQSKVSNVIQIYVENNSTSGEVLCESKKGNYGTSIHLFNNNKLYNILICIFFTFIIM